MVPVSSDNLCIPCISLVGGSRLVIPHPELRRMESSADEALFRCLTCDAWWDVRKLGWGRLTRPQA
jgi:hypothetical protein